MAVIELIFIQFRGWLHSAKCKYMPHFLLYTLQWTKNGKNIAIYYVRLVVARLSQNGFFVHSEPAASFFEANSDSQNWTFFSDFSLILLSFYAIIPSMYYQAWTYFKSFIWKKMPMTRSFLVRNKGRAWFLESDSANQWARKFKKVQAKKHVKSNKSISRKNFWNNLHEN